MNASEFPYQMVEEKIINDKNCLQFTFSGVLTQKDTVKACNNWAAIANQSKLKKFVIIIDALQMRDYEPMARNHFQKTLKELKGQIDHIWIVTESKLISSGAAIMSIFTSFPIKTVASHDAIAL